MELSTITTRGDDTNSTTRTAAYLAYHDDGGDSDVHVVGEGAGSEFHRAASQHTAVSTFWMDGMGQSEEKEEVLSERREGIMKKKKKRDLATEVKKATEYVEAAACSTTDSDLRWVLSVSAFLNHFFVH
jgi:hypothetical protein